MESHFRGKPPAVRALFERLCAKLKTFRPFRTDAVRSSINLVSTHHFGGVRVQQDGLRIGFVLSRPIQNPRITRMERLAPTIYVHRIQLTSPQGLDAELLGWLREAHRRSRR